MAQAHYARVDVEAAEQLAHQQALAALQGPISPTAIRWLTPVLAVGLSASQSVLWIAASNLRLMESSSLVPVIGFAVLAAAILIINPLMKVCHASRAAVAAVALTPLLAWVMAAVLPEAPSFFSTLLVSGSLTTASIWAWNQEKKKGRRTAGRFQLALGLALGAAVAWTLAFLGSPSIAAIILTVAVVGFFILRLLLGGLGFTRAELMLLFAAMMVTAGIPQFGLAEQLVPLISAPYDPQWNVPQRGWDYQVLPGLNRHLYITDTRLIAQFRQGLGMPPSENASWGQLLKFYWTTATRIPWMAWIGPLSFWAIFIGGCYLLFYSLTYVVLPLWSRREKLIFPLAKVPELILPPAPGTPGLIPPMFRRMGFWVGFILVFVILSWNAMVHLRWVASVDRILLGMGPARVNEVLAGSILQGLQNALTFNFIFTAAGLAFLIPVEMSFSVWFYFLLSRLIILFSVWWGYASNGMDFPTDLYWVTNPITAQGGGGMFIFSAISLWRCLAEYRRLAAGKPWRQKLVIGMPVVGLVASVAIITAWLSWNRMPWPLAMLMVLVIALLTVGMMRIVAESGLYWFQSHGGFFHLYRMWGLGRLFAPRMIAPIFPIYSVLFLDIKCFLPPSLVSVAKLREDVGGSRVRFHLTIVASLLASAFSSIFFTIYLAYIRGANQMHAWFYNLMPQKIYDTVREIGRQKPQVDLSSAIWFSFGGIWVALSLFLRRTLFWWPHPIGFIMLVNPLMPSLWFSFFVAWCIKKVVVRYGGKETYEKAQGVAVGVIAGELLAIAIWMGVAMYTGVALPSIKLNKYEP